MRLWSQGWVKLWSDGNHNHPNVDLKLYNNLFYNENGIALSRGAVYDKHQGTTADPNTVGFVFENNLLFLGSGVTPSMGILQQFASIDNQTVANPMLSIDYKLQTGSPDIDTTAADLRALEILGSNETFTDRNGIIKPSGGGFDIGAYEYVNTAQ